MCNMYKDNTIWTNIQIDFRVVIKVSIKNFNFTVFKIGIVTYQPLLLYHRSHILYIFMRTYCIFICTCVLYNSGQRHMYV